MGTAKRVSVTALRILTYTILIKAVISAVMLICTAAAWFSLRPGAPDLPQTGVVFVIAEAVGFINIVATVMCLSGISWLSRRFVAAHRIMVAVLITQCVLMMLITIELALSVNNVAGTAAVEMFMLAFEAADRLLIGAAFLFCMKGFGEILREDGDQVSAVAIERLGTAYFVCSIAGVIPLIMTFAKAVAFITIYYLAGAILEFLMYRKASDAAFRIWRKRAFDVSE